MIILGIDPGYDRLGVALIKKEKGKESLVFSSCLTTKKEVAFEDRLFFLGKEVSCLIKKYKPDCVALETLLFNTNKKTAMGVAEVRGVLIYETKKAGLPLYEYSPPQIKMALTGYGHADKKQVAFMIEKLLSLKLDTALDDECDAIAIALTKSAEVR